MGGAALLEPREVVDRDAGELGHLLATQAGGAAASGRAPDLGGVEPVAPFAQALGELVDAPMMAHAAGRRVALRVLF